MSSESSSEQEEEREEEAAAVSRQQSQSKKCCVCFEDIKDEDIAWTCEHCSSGYYWCKGSFDDMCFSMHRNNMPGIPKCLACNAKPSFSVMQRVLGPNWNLWCEKMNLGERKNAQQFFLMCFFFLFFFLQPLSMVILDT
jgi:hypothetical protein